MWFRAKPTDLTPKDLWLRPTETAAFLGHPGINNIEDYEKEDATPREATHHHHHRKHNRLLIYWGFQSVI
jgi:hypothetical protein